MKVFAVHWPSPLLISHIFHRFCCRQPLLIISSHDELTKPQTTHPACSPRIRCVGDIGSYRYACYVASDLEVSFPRIRLLPTCAAPRVDDVDYLRMISLLFRVLAARTFNKSGYQDFKNGNVEYSTTSWPNSDAASKCQFPRVNSCDLA